MLRARLPRLLRPRALVAASAWYAVVSCAAQPAPAPVPAPGLDPLAATTLGILAASTAAIEASALAIKGSDPSDTRAIKGSDPIDPTDARAIKGSDSSDARAIKESDPIDADLIDSIGHVASILSALRFEVYADSTRPAAERARTMTRLGGWDQAGQLIAAERAAGRATPMLAAAEAQLLLKRHRYADAERVVAAGLAAHPADRVLRLARGRLEIERWTLDTAAATANALVEEGPDDPAALLLLGRVHLLAKRYDDALAAAQQAQRLAPREAGGFLLEADVLFWREDPAGAEAPLRAALERDPFDPDARFAYGYAIWRRVDARQLDAMAAQWSLALAVDPLHYVTHWHWGNGHTNLTYADYAHPSDSLVREQLKHADSLIATDRPLDAIELARAVERDFPASVLPAMLRGSAFYMAYGMDREARLDSAQATFARILGRKPNYGPAHNGLAAVIKQRQVAVLQAFDSLEAVITSTPLPADAAFDSVFRDARYYPGDRVRRMVRQQLGPSAAYLPMLALQDRRFQLPPLHHDLAQAMERPSFRGATTFDNRQWMDIRGVGSGATGIEYVERGAHWERNVLNHEYVHLFHGRAFTDAENRRVRKLYFDAMRDGRTLDYYAANNESEFFAQAYEAFISPVKAHPLNHKAVNTRADLARKDPATYAFVDSLVRRQESYMAGDTAAFRSNWSQAYAYLADSLRGLYLSDSARSARAGDSVRLARVDDAAVRTLLADSVAAKADSLHRKLAEAAALLDSALRWDGRYVPALLSYAALRREERRFADAAQWIDRAAAVDPAFAPTYAARAVLIAERAEAEGDPGGTAFTEQAGLYERALALETDLAMRASLNGALRSLYLRHARIVDALRVADDYARTAPTVSTYLRDRRDDAGAFAAAVRSRAGYATQGLVFFDSLVPRKPQNWGLRQQYATALWAAGRPADALADIERAQRVLRAGAGASGQLAALAAEIHVAAGDTAAARREVTAVLTRQTRPSANDRRLVRVLALLGHADSAERRHATYRDEPDGPADRAEIAYTRAVIAEARGDAPGAEREYQAALADDPYHRHARLRLVALLRRAGRDADAEGVIADARQLPLPLGLDFERELRLR